MIKFPYARPNVSQQDIKSVVKALKNQYLTNGGVIQSFEGNLSRFFKVKNSIVCNSGTAALHLIYKCLGLKAGEAILTTPITFIATANAARMCNAKVFFSDVDANTGLMIPELIEKKLKNKKLNIKIVTVVHLGGRVCNLEEISKITKKYNCFLVEDACHAPGSLYIDKKNKTSKIGSCKYSIASSFGFHAIKHITMAEGGCITTNDNSLSNKIRLMLNHSMLRKREVSDKKSKFYQPWYYEVSKLGWNYRASEINCALGNSQLQRLEKIIIKRRKIAKLYFNELKSFKYIDFPKDAFHPRTNAWHLFTVFINFKKYNLKRSDIMLALEKKGIGTQVHYIPLYNQPLYKGIEKNTLNGSMEYYEKNVSLPIYETLKQNDIKFITKTLKEIILSRLK